MSDHPSTGRTNLEVVEGGLLLPTRDGALQLQLLSTDRVPRGVAAEIVEEDTHLLLSASNDIPAADPVHDHPIRIMTDLIEAKAAPPGSIRTLDRRTPVRILAIVHDIEQRPTWKEEWVTEALRLALEKVDELGLNSAACSVLASKHGSMAPERFAELLVTVAASVTFSALHRCTLLLPPLEPVRRRAVERVILSASNPS